MKRILMGLLLTGLFVNCGRPEVETSTCDVNTDYTSDSAQAARWLVGEWKLVEVMAMIPNPPVENLRLRFINSEEMTIIRDDQPGETNQYSVGTTSFGLRLQSNAEAQADNCYVRNASLRICANGLLLDCGMAMDLPAYRFQRIR